jgi:hypothetical protein
MLRRTSSGKSGGERRQDFFRILLFKSCERDIILQSQLRTTDKTGRDLRKETAVRTLMMVLVLVVLAGGLAGCNATAAHSINMNTKQLCNDTQRMLGLDGPNPSHPRDLISIDEAEPYRGYD